MQESSPLLAIQPAVTTIQEVIDQLDLIISWAKEQNSPLAYFPCLYRRVTIRVAKGIDANQFEDGARMERLDVAFANRYFEAIHTYTQGGVPSKAWKAAFEAAEKKRLIILQHLLLGINAHINLDLGISASVISRGGDIDALEKDFMAINKVLAEMTGEVQKDLNHLSPLFWIVDLISGKKDEYFAAFSIGKARDFAWASALRLGPLTPEEEKIAIGNIDEMVVKLAQDLISPPVWFIRLGLWFVKLNESKRVKGIIRVLYGG